VGFRVHQLRNSLQTAIVAVAALEQGNLPIGGATVSVLKRSLASLKYVIDNSLDLVQVNGKNAPGLKIFSLAEFISDVATSAALGLLQKVVYSW
jgi:hypothetical protein